MGSDSEEYSNWEDAFAPDATDEEQDFQASNEVSHLSQEEEPVKEMSKDYDSPKRAKEMRKEWDSPQSPKHKRLSPKTSSIAFLDIAKPPQHPSKERNKRQQWKVDKNAKYRADTETPSPVRNLQQNRKRFGMYSNHRKNYGSQKKLKADIALRKENKRLRTKLREFSRMLDEISFERNAVHHEPHISRDRNHKSREIDSLQRENTVLEKQCEGLKQENNETKRRLGHLRDALRIAKTVAYNKDRDCRKQHAMIESYKAKAKKLKRELADLRTEINKKGTEKSGAEVREEYEEMIKNIQNKTRKQKMKLQKRSLAQQNEIRRLQEVIDQRQTIIDNTLKQVGKFEKVLERQKTQISNLKKMQKKSQRRKIKQQSKSQNVASAIFTKMRNIEIQHHDAGDVSFNVQEVSHHEAGDVSFGKTEVNSEHETQISSQIQASEGKASASEDEESCKEVQKSGENSCTDDDLDDYEDDDFD